MKTYHCSCGQLIFFENVICVRCDRELGFLPDLLCLSSLEPEGRDLFRVAAPEAAGRLYAKCRNYAREVACNWMVPVESREVFCTSCRLDEMIPDLSSEGNQTRWRLIEGAKRRLIYTLLSLQLPLLNRADDPKRGMAFRFLEDGPDGVIMTGHDKGVITLNIAEADDLERERRRLSLKEPHRTLLGHFRHEIGHYYWDRLVAGTKYLEPFRELFGDERVNYKEALRNYYATGAPDRWQKRYISVYATAHAWEDWAETWAHYLHIQDTLEVALDFRLVDQRVALESKETAAIAWAEPKSFEQKIAAWSELTIALNSINRSLGLRDIYPFVLSRAVVEKLRFVADVIAGRDIPPRAAPRMEEEAPPAGPVNRTLDPGATETPPSVPALESHGS